jgi:hypothetical protein
MYTGALFVAIPDHLMQTLHFTLPRKRKSGMGISDSQLEVPPASFPGQKAAKSD